MNVVPVRVSRDQLFLAMADPLNFMAIEEAKRTSKKRIVPMIRLVNSIMESREEAVIEEYYKTLHIEALTMRDMARREILPACLSFERTVADGALAKKQLGLAGGAETRLLTQVSALNDALERAVSTLEEAVGTTVTSSIYSFGVV